MDMHPAEGEPAGGPEGPSDWIAEFRRQCDLVRMAADEWAVRWNEPEGRFIVAMLGAMQTLSRLVVTAQASLAATASEARARAETELAAAREFKRSVEAINTQSRNVHLLSMVERENMLQRMMKETLPLFADKLEGALVIRETAWNRDQRRRRYGLAGAVFLAVFIAGYALSAWSRHDQVAAMDRCMTNLVQANGHIFCAVDLALAPSPQPQGGGQ
jgi:hypothetical protein